MQGHCKHYDKNPPSLLCRWFLRAFALCWYKTIRGLARAGCGHSAYRPPVRPKRSVPFLCPHIFALCVPARGLWKPFPLILSYLFSFSSFLLLSWWWGVSSLVCFEWLIVSLAVIWYVTVLHKSFVSPHAESVASRIKPRILFQGVTNPPPPVRPTHPQTNSIMITDWYGRACQTGAPLEAGRCQGANQSDRLFIHFLVWASHPRSQSELLSAAGSLIISAEQQWWRIISRLPFLLSLSSSHLFSVDLLQTNIVKQTKLNAFNLDDASWDDVWPEKYYRHIVVYCNLKTGLPKRWHRYFTLGGVPVSRKLSQHT